MCGHFRHIITGAMMQFGTRITGLRGGDEPDRERAERAGRGRRGTDHQAVAKADAADQVPEARAGVRRLDDFASRGAGDAENVSGGEIRVDIGAANRTGRTDIFRNDGVDDGVDAGEGANDDLVGKAVVDAAVVGEDDERAAAGKWREFFEITGSFEKRVIERGSCAEAAFDRRILKGAGGEAPVGGELLREPRAPGKEKHGHLVLRRELLEGLAAGLRGRAEHASHAAGDVKQEEHLERRGLVREGLNGAHGALVTNDEIRGGQAGDGPAAPGDERVHGDQRGGGTEDGRLVRRRGRDLRRKRRGGEDENQRAAREATAGRTESHERHYRRHGRPH